MKNELNDPQTSDKILRETSVDDTAKNYNAVMENLYHKNTNPIKRDLKARLRHRWYNNKLRKLSNRSCKLKKGI